MKKKFFAVLLTASLLVGIMAAAAAASNGDSNTLSMILEGDTDIATVTTSSTNGKNSVEVSGVKQYDTKTYTLRVRRKDATGSKNRSVSVTGALSIKTALSAWGKVTKGDQIYDEATIGLSAESSGAGTLVLKGTSITGDSNTETATELTLIFDVDEAAEPTWAENSTPDNTDLGALYDATDGVIYGGAEVKSSDFATKFIATSTVASSDFTMTGTITPSGSGLELKTVRSGTNEMSWTGWLEGTATKVTSDTTYTLKVTAKDKAGSVEPREATFTIAAAPNITTSSTPGDITWGKSWSFKPSVSNTGYVDRWVFDDASSDVSADHLATDGITFDEDTGTLSGTWQPGKDSTDITGSSWDGKTDITKNIYLIAERGTESNTKKTTATKAYTLKFKSVVPTINETKTEIQSLFSTQDFKYGTEVEQASTDVKVTATGPGKITWTIDGKTDLTTTIGALGLKASYDQDGDTSTLYIFGEPTTTAKNQAITLVAVNGKGNSTAVAPTFSIGTDSFSLCVSTDTDANAGAEALPSGDKKVGESESITLVALPGPVTWTTKDLPTGLTLTVGSDTTTATISGKYTAGRTVEDGVQYTIKAVNNNVSGMSETLESGYIKVWEKPVISNAFAFAKKNTISTKTAYTWELEGTNYPKVASWDVKVTGLTGDTANGWIANNGKSKIKIVSSDTTTDKSFKLVGSLDRVPTNDSQFTVRVTAENYAGKSETKEFTVTVKGTAPALKKADLTLSGTTSKDIKVSAGDGPITMEAYIDAATAKKVFGSDYTDDISLKTSNVSGLLFDTVDEDGNAYIYSESSKYAYNKLPVTVTAKNESISSKTASAKYTVTIAGTKPAWKTSDDLTAYGSTLKASDDLTQTVALKVPAKSALTPIVIVATGSGPFTYTVKPEEKNGLTATLNESAGTVTIAGTPEAAKKDVVTKFTLTVKNNSTGDSAKSDISITAQPKPEADSTTLSATVLMGKKVKLTPKMKVSANGMKWVMVEDATQGTNTYTEEQLKDTWGLTLDENKGTIAGTPKQATGKTNKLTIKIQASGDVSSSDVVTAEIAVLGAKPKLTTKKLSVAIDGGNIDSAVIETNLKGKAETEADVQFEGNFSDVEAVSGLSFTDGSDTNTAGLSGTPSAVTKKAVVTVTMNNYDTEAKGKLSITVTGATPEIAGDQAVDVTAGSSQTTTLSINNPNQVSNKIKWKIARKPTVSGVSAKVKGDVNGATVTVKANKKVSNSTVATFTVTATDSVSKSTSAEYEITATITNTEDASDTPLEAPEAPETDSKTESEAETKADDKAEEKILGEGEVHMGAERTADKLTAAQRKAIEDEGYVIAAVLPEIEVTASGQYDFEVELDKEVAAGAELVWFAFSTKPTTDDEIVDFADEKGEETKVVPESHVVIVAPWLNAETKYAPVIAVKADAKDAEATTVEDVKEAAEAKTEE